jgi:hypothetical protein
MSVDQFVANPTNPAESASIALKQMLEVSLFLFFKVLSKFYFFNLI